MTRKKRLTWVSLIAFMFLTAAAPATFGMHVVREYLSPVHCVAWGVICIPFLTLGVRSIKKSLEEDRRNITLLAMAGAFIFVISSLKVPSVTGSCSHVAGTGLDTILLGPTAVSILGVIVLLFRTLLLAHGGITMLRINTFSMTIAGPLLSHLVYRTCKEGDINRTFSVLLAAFLGGVFTYCVTSLQLVIAYPSTEGGIEASAMKLLGVLAPTQLPLTIIEGILTITTVITLGTYTKSELKAIEFMKEAA